VVILVWTGLAVAALALIAVLASAGRLRRFLKLREEVRTRLKDLATVVAPAQAETKAVLDEAQHVFHELGTRMSGFARRGIAKLSIRGMGFDPSSAASGLIGFSNALPVYGIERLRWRAQVVRALKIQNAGADARMKRSRLDPLIFVLALAALAFSAWMYTANRNLHQALQSAHVVRAATRDRAAQAEKAKLAAEQSIAEVRAQLVEARNGQSASERSLAEIEAQLALTQKAKVAAELSVEKMKEQLASSESARKAAEDRLKALGDELAALTTAKDDAERSLKAANDQLARLKSAKEDSDAAAAKAVEELERERKSREAAEQAPPSPPAPTP
jgi:hypothetical protein